jgi:hypothetical protein
VISPEGQAALAQLELREDDAEAFHGRRPHASDAIEIPQTAARSARERARSDRAGAGRRVRPPPRARGRGVEVNFGGDCQPFGVNEERCLLSLRHIMRVSSIS